MNEPSATVPFNPWSDHVAAVSSRRKRPFASNSRARSFTVWPGFSTSSVGDTCTKAASPSPFSAGASTAVPVSVFAAFGPIAYTASLETKKMRPRDTAAPRENRLRRAFLLLRAVLAHRQLHFAQDLARDPRDGRTMKNLPLSVPT